MTYIKRIGHSQVFPTGHGSQQRVLVSVIVIFEFVCVLGLFVNKSHILLDSRIASCSSPPTTHGDTRPMINKYAKDSEGFSILVIWLYFRKNRRDNPVLVCKFDLNKVITFPVLWLCQKGSRTTLLISLSTPHITNHSHLVFPGSPWLAPILKL